METSWQEKIESRFLGQHPVTLTILSHLAMLSHFFSAIFVPFSSKFFTKCTLFSAQFLFILTARPSCALYEASVFWEKWYMSHGISLQNDAHSQDREKLGYTGNDALLTSLSLIWPC